MHPGSCIANPLQAKCIPTRLIGIVVVRQYAHFKSLLAPHMTGEPTRPVFADALEARGDSLTASKVLRSNLSPSMGSSSIFQSPVCTMFPCSLRRIMPQQSGMECVTLMGWHLCRHTISEGNSM